jgi:hypothetical protein
MSMRITDPWTLPTAAETASVAINDLRAAAAVAAGNGERILCRALHDAAWRAEDAVTAFNTRQAGGEFP